MDRQFCLDMAAAYEKSSTAQNKAHAAAYRALAARLDTTPTPTPVPVPTPTPTPTPSASVRPFASTSPFNTPTPAGTVWGDLAVLHAQPWWVNVDAAASVRSGVATDPTWTLRLPAYIALDYHRNRPALTVAGLHLPANVAAGTDSDHILSIYDPTTGVYYDLWLAVVDAAARSISCQAWATGNMITGPGAGTLANNDGVRAANFCWLAGAITAADVASGKIDHALVVALNGTQLASGQANYVAPATAWENTGNGPIKMGTRLGVPVGTAKPAGLSAIGAMVWDALVKYGAFVGDYAGGGNTPMLYAQPGAITAAQQQSLIGFWNAGGCDFDRIGPLVRIAG